VDTYSGDWWLPHEPGRRLSGDLTSDDVGLVLELRGTFAQGVQEQFRAFGNAVFYPIVLGETTNGKLVTVESATQVNMQLRFGTGLGTEKLRPLRFYVGGHARTPNDLTWTRLTFSVRHLREWFGDTGLREEYTVEDDRFMGYQLSFRYPDGLHADLPGAVVEQLPGFKLSGDTQRTRGLEPTAAIRVDVEEEMRFDALAEGYLHPLQDLVTLATGAPCPVTELTLGHRDVLQPGGEHPVAVEVHYTSPRLGEESETVLTPHEMLFRAVDIADRFGDAIAGWLAAWEECRATCALLFGMEYIPERAFPTRVLNIAQAAEVFHRVRHPGGVLAPDAQAERLSAVLDSAPEEHRDWLQRALRFSNEPDLGRRLRTLYDGVRPVMEPIEPDRHAFVEVIVHARNDISHRGRLPDGTDWGRLLRAVEATRFLLMASLCLELGFTPEETAVVVANNARYQNLVQ
jgi:hypothetical protein